MELERRLAKVARYHLALFLLPMLSLLYYGWWKAPDLDQRPDNPLGTAPMSRRGDILDRHHQPLAHSQNGQRVYPLKEKVGPLVGYHLRGRNQSGLEASLQATLSPPPPPKSLWGAIARDRSNSRKDELLKGPSVVLTIDSGLQSKLYQLFGNRAGVIVVAERASGDILAAVSCPSFDPNRVAESWQELRGDPRSPFIERIGSGLYPVRSSTGTDLIASDLVEGHPWFSDNPFPRYPGASSALTVEGRQLLSPLMLLALAAGPDWSFQPRLLSSPLEETESVSAPEVPLPSLGEGQSHNGFQLFRLLGPAFRESPAFDVVVGRPGEEKNGLVFALVVEEHSEGASELGKETVKILREWSQTW